MFKKLAKWIDPLANPNTTSGLDEVVGTFSLHRTQLFVGSVKTEDGQTHKVLNLKYAVNSEESSGLGLYKLTSYDARRFVNFLQEVLQGNLPVDFVFPVSETRFHAHDERVKWTISAFVDRWHHGGGYKGKLGGVGGYVITKQSAERLKDCVSEYFGV